MPVVLFICTSALSVGSGAKGWHHWRLRPGPLVADSLPGRVRSRCARRRRCQVALAVWNSLSIIACSKGEGKSNAAPP